MQTQLRTQKQKLRLTFLKKMCEKNLMARYTNRVVEIIVDKAAYDYSNTYRNGQYFDKQR